MVVMNIRVTFMIMITLMMCSGPFSGAQDTPSRRRAQREGATWIGSVAKWRLKQIAPTQNNSPNKVPFGLGLGAGGLGGGSRGKKPACPPAPNPQPKRNFIRGRVLRRGDWLQTPLRHASNPCGSFSLRTSAAWCVLGPTEGATTHHSSYSVSCNFPLSPFLFGKRKQLK